MHRFNKIKIEQELTILSFTANNLVEFLDKDYFIIYPNPNSTQCFPLIVTLEVYHFFPSPKQVDKQDFFLANARRVLVAKGFDKIMILGNPPEQELWIMRGRAKIICDARRTSNAFFYSKGSNVEALRMYAEQYIFLFAIRNSLQLIKSLFSIYKRTNREAISSAWEKYLFTIGVGDSFHLISKQIDRYSLRMASNINTLDNKKMNSLPKIRRSLVAEQLNHDELVAARLSIDRVTVNYTQSEKLAYQRGIDSAMQTVSQLKSKSEIATALLAFSVAISESIDSENIS